MLNNGAKGLQTPANRVLHRYSYMYFVKSPRLYDSPVMHDKLSIDRCRQVLPNNALSDVEISAIKGQLYRLADITIDDDEFIKFLQSGY